MPPFHFSAAVLRWFNAHGRKQLPWQHRSPYAVWVSEIMLQQTQVQTVIPYFTAFMQAFPDIETLAAADIDAVLAKWTGLGYYARARHLHHAAQQVVAEHGGVLPDDLTALQALPGIGRSTAGAIASLGYDKPAAILDGNVKRVLCRFYALPGWPGHTAAQKTLWQHAEALTPKRRTAAYNQAMMDLGALICTRRNPACSTCPLQAQCQAYRADCVHDYPHRKPRKPLPEKRLYWLMIENTAGHLLLEKRVSHGIWGGLWCFPEHPTGKDLNRWCKKTLGTSVLAQTRWPSITHTLSHWRLQLIPIHLRLACTGLVDSSCHIWYDNAASVPGGFPAPVKQLLQRIATHARLEEMTDDTATVL